MTFRVHGQVPKSKPKLGMQGSLSYVSGRRSDSSHNNDFERVLDDDGMLIQIGTRVSLSVEIEKYSLNQVHCNFTSAI